MEEERLYMVQIKDMAGEYEPIGVMPFRQAVREQFTRHRPAHIQPVGKRDRMK